MEFQGLCIYMRLFVRVLRIFWPCFQHTYPPIQCASTPWQSTLKVVDPEYAQREWQFLSVKEEPPKKGEVPSHTIIALLGKGPILLGYPKTFIQSLLFFDRISKYAKIQKKHEICANVRIYPPSVEFKAKQKLNPCVSQI